MHPSSLRTHRARVDLPQKEEVGGNPRGWQVQPLHLQQAVPPRAHDSPHGGATACGGHAGSTARTSQPAYATKPAAPSPAPVRHTSHTSHAAVNAYSAEPARACVYGLRTHASAEEGRAPRTVKISTVTAYVRRRASVHAPRTTLGPVGRVAFVVWPSSRAVAGAASSLFHSNRCSGSCGGGGCVGMAGCRTNPHTRRRTPI